MNAAPRRLRLELAYDGTRFAGWQFQPGQRTVQGELERVLGRLAGGEAVRVHGAGRTDSGAHAAGQVAHCDVRTRLADAELAHGLRQLLPGDLRPLSVGTVAPDFDSRYHATGKCYSYTLDLTRWGDPFQRRFRLHWPHRFEPQRMEPALRLLPGRRDWSGFAASKCSVVDRIRELREASFAVAPDGSSGRFTFVADGFLTHMVRNVVGTLLEIAGARMPATVVAEILDSGDRGRAGPTAPACGLCLERVDYGR